MKYKLVNNLNLKWQIKKLPYYKWSECKKLINTRTGKEIKKTINGGSIGYWIGKAFIPITSMSNMVELIPKQKIDENTLDLAIKKSS